MKISKKNFFIGLAFLGAIFPLFAFAQVVNNPNDQPSTFNAGTPGTGFSLVSCDAPSITYTDANGKPTTVNPVTGDATTACDFAALMLTVQRFINLLLYVMVFIAVAMIVWAGYNYLTAGGNTGKIKKAHDIFRVTIFGMIIALASWVVVNTVVTAVIATNFTYSSNGAPANNLLQKQ